jgi:chromosome segregation ATPase
MFDFPLTVADLESVPEKYRALYVEEDGEFKLESDLFTKIDKLAKTIDKERKRAKDAERDAKSWADVGGTPEEVKAKLEEMEAKHAEEIEKLQKLIDEKGDSAGKIEKIKKELEKARDEALAKKDQELAAMEGTLRSHLMESAAKAAIAEAKGKIKPLLPYVMKSLSFVKENGQYAVRVLDEDGEVRLTKDGKDMGIRELVEELKADQDFSALFEGSGTTGSGSNPKGSGGGGLPQNNPWAKETRNLTEQMRIARENPSLANRLKAQAGA